MSVMDRFFSKVAIGPGACWIWKAHTDAKGYGRFKVAGKSWLAYRWLYTQLIEEPAEGITLDHLCAVKACVNPAHLQPVTNKVNVLRGTGPTAVNASKTHCPRGHGYDRVAKRKDGSSFRYCSSCRRKGAK